jgi:catechol 2,3-dioxygenase-like lactoylglutathione lyase family enzyme
MNITYQGSVIFVQDIAASRHFYEDLLGQQVDIDFGPSIGFKLGDGK